MQDFEKFLTDLPKPAVDVPVFRDQLRRELLSAIPPERRSTARFALILSSGMAAVLATLLLLFIVRPAIPAGIYTALIGQRPPAAEGFELEQWLERATPLLDADRAFVEDWTAQQAQPVAVRSMEDEMLYKVTQFELTDGKRMLVFTELGKQGTQPAVLPATSARLY